MPQSPSASRATKPSKKHPEASSPANGLSKSARVLAMLHRKEGATLAELVEATGWQPHTTRAVLTGLRKKGHGIERGKRGDVTCYQLRIVAA